MRGPGVDPQAIAARTPPDRDRVADLLRLTAICLVVLGHWLVTAVLHRDGELVVGQALQWVPQAHVLTWIFQVMPLFFFVGGSLNRASWQRAREHDQPWARWVRRRAARLLTPMLPVLVAAAALVIIGAQVDVPSTLVRRGAEAMLLPLWFLVVYLLVIALVPVTLWLHERAGPAVPAGALLLTGLIDVLHRAQVPVVGFASYLLLWGGVHQLGYFWNEARLPRPRLALVLAGVAAAVTAGLIRWFDYPLSMVAVFGDPRHNTDPPSLALWTFALMQLALVVAARHPLRRLLERPRVWAPVTLAGSSVLTIFLWHMTAMVVVGLAVIPTGVWPRSERIDGGWWAMRPVWLLACIAVLVVLIAVFRRLEDLPPPAARDRTLPALFGLTAFAAGLARIMTAGLTDPTHPTGLRVVPLIAVLIGMAVLGALAPTRLVGRRREPRA
ncbi:MAG: acyltransferase [Nitriliruptoraceae bacterium]|nr:acyltransferase [Nitriliruptoraceae bacterium]